MSFPEGPIGSGDKSRLDENAPSDAAEKGGFFEALQRFSKRWSRRYIEMRVDALASRRD